MTIKKRNSVLVGLFFVICLPFISQCRKNDNSLYQKIHDHADRVKVINTHEHQHWPEEYGNFKFRFWHLINASYLAADVRSAGAGNLQWRLIDSLDLDQLWNLYGKSLDFTRTSSYYGQFVKGFRKLYDSMISISQEKILNYYRVR